MKLFIWEGDGVLQDYSSGMIVALAAGLAVARRAVARKLYGGMATVRQMPDPEVVDLPGCAPKRTRVWLVHGGS